MGGWLFGGKEWDEEGEDEDDDDEEEVTAAGRVLNRSPVDIPTRDVNGE